MDDIFKPDNIVGKHGDYYLQTILYADIVCHDRTLNRGGLPVKPQLFYVQNAKEEGDDLSLLIGGEPVVVSRDFGPAFHDGLARVVNDIFDLSLPFQPNVSKQCDTCPFRPMCY